MKRTLGFFLALIILLSAVPAFASNSRTSGPYTYEIKGNGTITITDFNWGKNSGDIYIPNMIDGYTVTAIGDEAFKCDVMRRGVGSLKRENNFDTVNLTIPDSIKSIGKKAFWNATLASINLPEGLQNIGYGAFVGNPTIQFKINGQHPYFAVINGGLYSKINKELLAYPLVDEVYETSKQYTYAIPEGILSIADYAFYRDVEAEKNAVYKNKYFIFPVEIHLASTIQKIGDYAFSGFYFDGGCENMLPTALESIGESAFKGAHGNISENIIIPDGVTYIGREAFKDSDLTFRGDIVFSENCALTVIEEESFWRCRTPIKVETANIRSVAPYAFFDAFHVEWEHVESIEDWGDYAFAETNGGCVLPKSYTFSPKLTKIPAGFNLDVTLPDSVEAISSNAFQSVVENYRLKSSLNDIAVDAFPKGSTFIVDAGSYAELWCSENGFGYTVEGQEDDLSWLNS